MEDLTGRTIGGYQIVEKIGRGGMATVFRAYQPSLDRDVAIKVLPPYYAEQDETFLQRFKREARAIASLRHPNILMVMDFGQQGDLAYLVMEYVTAGTLKERMRRPIRLEQIYHLVNQVGDALQYAHDQGVVHRDIKPSNIMMPKPDWALLTDFGLATMVGGSFLTQSGMTVGTPAYMSPEQGSGERVDHRTDIYSLGIMLYEMVVGEVPYTAETPMAVVVKHIVDPLPIPREKNPDIPEDLQRVILKSLAKNPDDRYQRAADFTAALRDVANVHPDWSATEIRTVTAVRTPYVDRSETQPLEEDDLTAVRPEDRTVPPTVAEPLPATQPEDVPDSQSEVLDSEPMLAEPESEDLSEASQALPEESQTEVPEPEQAQLGQPEVRKKRRWLVYLGAVVTVFVCVMLILVGLGAIRDINKERSIAEKTQTAEEAGQPPADGMEGVGPEEPEEDFPRIVELLEQREYDRAHEIALRMIRRNPARWEIFMNVVFWLVERAELEQAAGLLEAGLEAHPEPPAEGFATLGWLLVEQGRHPDALRHFEQALRINPGLLEAHTGLIQSSREIGQVPREIEFLAQLSEEHPEEPLILRSLGELYLEIGDVGLALGYFQRALELAPDNPYILTGAAHVHILLGEQRPAVEMLERAVELAPEDPRILGRAAESFMGLEMVDRARELYQRAYDLDMNNGGYALGLAMTMYIMDQDSDRIVSLLERVEQMGLEQQDPWLLAHLGWTYLEMRDCGNAIRIFEIAEELAPGETNALEGIDECR